MGRKAGKLKVKGRKYSFSCPIIKFEKKCFDWVGAGEVVTRVDDGLEISSDGTRVRSKSHIIKKIYFRRPYDYAKNFLFGFTEVLSNIVSFFRVLAISLLIPAVIVGIILMILNSEMIATIIGIYLGVYGGLIAASLVLAGFGALWRKVFKLTEKTDAIQQANGYMKWSEYEDDDSIEFECV